MNSEIVQWFLRVKTGLFLSDMWAATAGEVVVHRYAGILSAYGMGLADVIEEAQEPYTAKYGPAALEEVSRRSAALIEEVKKQLRIQVMFPLREVRRESETHILMIKPFSKFIFRTCWSKGDR